MYYFIENDLDSKVSGYVWHQQAACTTIVQAQMITSRQLYDLKPRLKFELEKRAKLTDFLHTLQSVRPVLMSCKVKNIIEECKIIRHQYFDAKVLDQKGNEHLYFWLHLSDPEMIKNVDYNKSSFYIEEVWTRKGDVKLKSYEDYQNAISKLDVAELLSADKIVLSDKFDRALDLFTLLPLDNKIYISEKLKNKLEAADVTGIKIIKTDKIE